MFEDKALKRSCLAPLYVLYARWMKWIDAYALAERLARLPSACCFVAPRGDGDAWITGFGSTPTEPRHATTCLRCWKHHPSRKQAVLSPGSNNEHGRSYAFPRNSKIFRWIRFFLGRWQYHVHARDLVLIAPCVDHSIVIVDKNKRYVSPRRTAD